MKYELTDYMKRKKAFFSYLTEVPYE